MVTQVSSQAKPYVGFWFGYEEYFSNYTEAELIEFMEEILQENQAPHTSQYDQQCWFIRTI